MSPFQIIQNFFNVNEYKKVTKIDKIRNAFMINRLCSINFPLQAALLSMHKNNPIHLIDFWQYYLSKYYKKAPPWLYIKTKADKVKQKEKLKDQDKVIKYTDIDSDLIRFFCKINQCSEKELKVFYQINPQLCQKYLSELQEIFDFENSKITKQKILNQKEE